MYNYSLNGITISTILDTRREVASGGFPVKIRVTHRRERKYYSTGIILSEDAWEKLPNSRSKESNQIKEDLQHIFAKIRDSIKTIEQSSFFDFNILNDRLGRVGSNTLNGAFREKVKTLIEQDRIGTSIYYKTALKNIEEFSKNEIPYTSITLDWLHKFDKFMQEKGRNVTTRGFYFRAIRAIINEAIRDGRLPKSQYPFGKDKFEIQSGQGRKLALTLNQIKEIINYHDLTEAGLRSRDLWYFSYLCNGLNFNDLLKLKNKNIQDGEILFIRAKTRKTNKHLKEISAIITPDMEKIINKWGKKSSKPDDYIFPFLEQGLSPIDEKKRITDFISRTNSHLKKIGNALGVSGLTTYTARHSFATVLKRSGANIAFISEALGHNNLKTTENYLASFEKSERIKASKMLTNFSSDDE